MVSKNFYFLSDYRGNLKRFLDATCEKLNNDWEDRKIELEDTVSKFEKAVQTTITIFGEENIFRVWSSNSHTYRRKLNRAILDIMTFYFSDSGIGEAAKNNKEQVENAFKNLCSASNSEFIDAVEKRTTSIRATYTRLLLWGTALRKVLDVEFNLPGLADNRIIFNGLKRGVVAHTSATSTVIQAPDPATEVDRVEQIIIPELRKVDDLINQLMK